MLLLQNDDEAIRSAKNILHNSVHTYRANSWKMWVYISCGMATLLVLSGFTVKLASLIANALYDREGLELVAA